MGKRTSYAPGTFSWVGPGTTDAAAAKAFYTGMFGWEMEDNDAGGGAVYTVCRVDGDATDDGFGAMDVGRRAVLRDPQGAVFALFEGRVDP